jgi:hypothetical protein
VIDLQDLVGSQLDWVFSIVEDGLSHGVVVLGAYVTGDTHGDQVGDDFPKLTIGVEDERQARLVGDGHLIRFAPPHSVYEPAKVGLELEYKHVFP